MGGKIVEDVVTLDEVPLSSLFKPKYKPRPRASPTIITMAVAPRRIFVLLEDDLEVMLVV